MPAMKRKLNEHDVPEASGSPGTSDASPKPAKPAKPAKSAKKQKAATEVPAALTATESTFDSLGLTPLLLRGIRDQRWVVPTGVQAKAIPLALEGKDLLARSGMQIQTVSHLLLTYVTGTGSGKTAAYLLPILHGILRRKQRETSALVLVPTKELALQVSKLAQTLGAHCGQELRVQNIAGKESDVVQRAKLADLPDLVVATPARASVNINNGALSLKNIAHLVVDEADLVMGYGFEQDLDSIAKNMPKGVQIL